MRNKWQQKMGMNDVAIIRGVAVAWEVCVCIYVRRVIVVVVLIMHLFLFLFYLFPILV